MLHGTAFLSLFFLVLCLLMVGVQPVPSPPELDPGIGYQDPRTRFSRFMAIITVACVGTLFVVGIVLICIRHLYNRSCRAVNTLKVNLSVVGTYPTFTYSDVKDGKLCKGSLECAVCLNEFKDEESLRLIPKCHHLFHLECIDAWLKSHSTCPICRADLVPGNEHTPELTSGRDEQNNH